MQTSKHHSPVARGPLVEVHRAAGATLAIVNGWEVAVEYPGAIRTPPIPPLLRGGEKSGSPLVRGGNAIVDQSHWRAYEVNGSDVDVTLQSIVGEPVPVRRIVVKDDLSVYRLTARRAIVFETAMVLTPPIPPLVRGGVLDVTGGWASFILCGPDLMNILNKVTAVDLREQTLPLHACCQGPIFGVNTLFGRFEHGFELHVCPDSAEFFWEVLLDAGREFGLKPAGIEQFGARRDSRTSDSRTSGSRTSVVDSRTSVADSRSSVI